MVKKRGLVSFILLSLVTFGIYGLWRIHVLARDVNLMCEGDGKKTRGLFVLLFLGLITVGIYMWIWLYILGDRLYDNAARYNLLFRESGFTIILHSLVGIFTATGPLLTLYILFKNTNSLANEYNKTVRSKDNKTKSSVPRFGYYA